MNYSQPLTASERKVLQPLLRDKPTNKVMFPKEKYSDKNIKNLPIR